MEKNYNLLFQRHKLDFINLSETISLLHSGSSQSFIINNGELGFLNQKFNTLYPKKELTMIYCIGKVEILIEL